MRFETTSRPLRDLVKQFHNGAILLPQFQRDYVWRPSKIRNLLDSLLRDYPIGGFYFWRPAGGLHGAKPKAFVDRTLIAAEFVGYLIDGQQRLTSLEAAFGLYTGEDKRGAELRCYLDLAADDIRARDTRLFVSYAGHRTVARRVDNGDSTLVPLHLLFEGGDYDLRRQTEEVLRILPEWSSRRIADAMKRFDRARAMLEQQVPCTTVFDLSDRHAVDVFSRLNKGGSSLRAGDVRAAELARGATVEVLTNMRAFVSRERAQRLGFGFSFAFRTLVIFHRESAQFNRLSADWMDIPSPGGRQLKESWAAAAKAIDAALEFVDNTMGWSRRALVPSTNATIVLAVALDASEFHVTSEAGQRYRRWLCLTAIRKVFQGSVETTINRFLRSVRSSSRDPSKSLLDGLKRHEARRLKRDDFYAFSQAWGPATQVMHAWLVSQGAKDWLSGEALDDLARAGADNSPVGDLAVHHIFPRTTVIDVTEDPEHANCPANYALLCRASSSALGEKDPASLLGTITDDEKAAANAQYFFGQSLDQLQPSRFDDFCRWRADRLAEGINGWLGIA